MWEGIEERVRVSISVCVCMCMFLPWWAEFDGCIFLYWIRSGSLGLENVY